MKKTTLVVVMLILGGCASDDVDTLKSFARKGEFPTTLSSHDAAMDYVRNLHIRGRVDRVGIGWSRFMVIFQHGSGIPVTRIAVYRRTLWNWKLVAEPRLTRPAEGSQAGGEFLRATASDGKIFAVGERSNYRWLLHEPK